MSIKSVGAPVLAADVVTELCSRAVAARQFAFCPYSHYDVGCCVLGDDGRMFTGCNVENASFGLTMCAERTAVCKAVSEGCRKFRAMAVAAADGNPSPCGACRQVMVEFGNFDVILVHPDGNHVFTTTHALLPGSFNYVDAMDTIKQRELAPCCTETQATTPVNTPM